MNKQIDFKNHVTDFLKHFYMVFEADWGYTQPYISNTDARSLLDPSIENANWGNRDNLVQ